MKVKNICLLFLIVTAMVVSSGCSGKDAPPLSMSSQDTLRAKAHNSLESLYASSIAAQNLRNRSVGILVFPDVLRAGFIVGGAGGNGVLFSPNGNVMGYYNVADVSFGLQAGVQGFDQAMFFTTSEALGYLEDSAGWSIGVGPTVVVVNEGAAKEVSTTTARSDIYAFIYGQGGLMAGIGVQGQKITKLRPVR